MFLNNGNFLFWDTITFKNLCIYSTGGNFKLIVFPKLSIHFLARVVFSTFQLIIFNKISLN